MTVSTVIERNYKKKKNLPGEDSSPKEVLAEEAPKNCSYRRRDSGTGLTMNRRPAECTTWAVVLGEMPERKVNKRMSALRCDSTKIVVS